VPPKRFGLFHQQDLEAAAAGRHGGGETGRAAAQDNHVIGQVGVGSGQEVVVFIVYCLLRTWLDVQISSGVTPMK
jgi:hypothetical protein